MVDLEGFADPEEEQMVRNLIERHAELTKSRRATDVLENWAKYREKFQKVMPLEFRRALNEQNEPRIKTAMVN